MTPQEPPFIAAADRAMYADYTLATYDYWVALRAGDQAAMAEALNRQTWDDEFGSLQHWLDEVAPADEMAKYRTGELSTQLEAWEGKLRFDMKCDQDNWPD